MMPNFFNDPAICFLSVNFYPTVAVTFFLSLKFVILKYFVFLNGDPLNLRMFFPFIKHELCARPLGTN